MTTDLPLVVRTRLEWATPDHPAQVRAVSQHTSETCVVDYDWSAISKPDAHQLAVQRLFPLAAVHYLHETDTGCCVFYVEPAIRT